MTVTDPPRFAVQSTQTSSKSPVARELRPKANKPRRWDRELHEAAGRTFGGQGEPRDVELVTLKRELARVTRGRTLGYNSRQNKLWLYQLGVVS